MQKHGDDGRRGRAGRLVVVWLSAALAALPQQAVRGRKQSAAGAPPERLVWPAPPDLPRVRWLEQYRDLENLGGGAKKRSLVERLAGARPLEEKKLRFQRPYGVAVDSRGRIVVADTAAGAVFVLDRSAKTVHMWTGSSRAPMALPVGVALDRDDRLFVSDAYLHSVTCLDSQGQVLAQFGRDKLERAAGVALDTARRRLYVSDVKANRIAVFHADTYAFERLIGGPSTPDQREEGKFSAPTNLATDRLGNLYVTDTYNNRIQIFDAGGRFIRAFGVHGVSPGQFVRPKGIAVDSEGHVYVADSEFNNIQIFTPEGRPLLVVGSLGGQPGQFLLLAGLAIDARDQIYTTEQENARVQVFQYLAEPAPGKEREVTKASR